ncbi:FMN-binding negative transcriptional regulator [Cnuibacter sp. UC19_7]|uniref:FMN-binding negative transcriptional regulator n=1 Tax=Cnuibacter sp. UC19_7 TaxID=3350166 RepID=UPI00366C258A
MRENPSFALTERDEIARLVREHPWATMVSRTADGLVASHYPFLLEETTGPESDELVLVTHVGRPDERLHELGEHEIVVIVQGPHGYISSGWYGDAPSVPTWNHISAHLYGTPEILSADENLAVLERLVEHFEREQPSPRLMRGTLADSEYADRISAGTVGFRLRVTRVVAKAKLSQNKPSEVVETVLAELEGDGPYAQPALAAEMRRVHPDLGREDRA